MSQFIGLIRYEFKMSIRRPGLWIAYGLLFAFYTVVLFASTPGGVQEMIANEQLWQYAGRFVLQFNIFLPVVAGILASDRLQRDFRLGVHELQDSTPIRRPAYVLGKYIGVLSSMLLPVFLWVLVVSVGLAVSRQTPPGILYAMPLAFLAMTLPAFAFVTAFSLACPLVMPLRVYQILFTGYWFWGNFLNPEAFPTLNGTLLTAGGMYAFQGYFGGFPESINVPLQYTALDATLNLLVLALCIIAVLFVLDRFLKWQARRA